MFGGCHKLADVNGLSAWDTNKVTYMKGMFDGCTKLADVNGLSAWDTSKVTDMEDMFYICSSLADVNGLSAWDTSKVTDMSYMFYNCSSLSSADLSSWDTSKVTDMRSMFYGCTKLTEVNGLSEWDTSKVMYMSNMFYNCSRLADVSGLSEWDTSKVTNMSSMFQSCSSLADLSALSKWDTSKVTYMSSMFQGCTSLADLSSLSGWDTNNVINMSSMFQSCSSLADVRGLSEWDTSKVTNMSSMFSYCEMLKEIDLSYWFTSFLEDTRHMFSYCYELRNVDLSNWRTSSLQNISYMFLQCKNLKTINVSGSWRVLGVSTGYEVFKNCNSLVGHDVNNMNSEIRYTDNKTDLSMANYTGGYLTYKGNEILLQCMNGQTVRILNGINNSSQLPVPTREGYNFDGWYYGFKIGILDEDKVEINSFINSNTDYPWTKDGNGIWSSGNKGKANTESKMISDNFTLNDDGIISFDWRSNGENSYDYLGYDILKVNTGKYLSGKSNPTYSSCLENLKGKASRNYLTVTRKLSAGTYQIVFMYGKDGSGSNNEDQGFVKNVYYGPSSYIYSNPIGENEDLIMGATLYAKWTKKED